MTAITFAEALPLEGSRSRQFDCRPYSLADELGYTGDKSESAAMNIWLHKEVLKKPAENGGDLPDTLIA